MIHRKRGASIDHIAEITNLKRATVHSILRRFQERGISGKDAIKQTGRPAFLTPKQRKELSKTTRKRTAKKQKRTLVHQRSQRIHQRKIRRRIHKRPHLGTAQSLGFTLQRPRPRHRKAPDAEELERFKKKLPGWRAIIEQEAG